MKIVYLVSHFGEGGAERTVAYLSNYISKNKNDENIILSLSNEVFYEISNDVKFISLGIPQNSNNVFNRLKYAFLRLIKVRKTIRKLKPDVVICMLATTAKYLPKKRNYKLICSERSNPLIVTDNKQIKLRNSVLQNADGIVFQTDRAKECFSKSIQEKGVVIQNAVGNNYVYKVESVKERKKTITAIGRLHKAKDYPTLIKAFSEVSKKYPDFTLEIFGGGDKEPLQKLITELNIQDKIKFMGSREDAILEVSKSSCYVLSSIYEGMPNALMEAMAVGTPCVATDCPFGPSELIKDGENGLLVPVGDVEGLANAICKFIEDKEFAYKCSQNAIKILETNSIDIIAEKYYQYIKNL